MKSHSILVSLIIALLAATAANAKYSGGTGDPNDPYRIASAEDLNDIGNHQEDFDKHFILVNDVNLAQYTGTQFKIIGTSYNTPFIGVFDGNDHEISNLTYESASIKTDNVGLFGFVGENAVVKDLTLTKANVYAGIEGNYIGSLVGELRRGVVQNCHIQDGNVIGYCSIGGLVGCNDGGNIALCDSIVNVSGNYNVGGLVGCFREGIIELSYSKGNVYSLGWATGGLVGQSWENGKIINCYSLCDVQGYNYVGGLVGWNIEGADIENCFSAGKVSGSQDFGGLVGRYYSGTITGCFWDRQRSDCNESAGGTPKTTAEMKIMSTFTDAGWDFVEIWGIGENQTYPFLRTELAGDLNHDKKVDLIDLAILAEHWLEEK
jgi:hypothetical protein